MENEENQLADGQADKIKIIITEDQQLLRKSFITLLRQDPSFDIIGEAGNGKELLDLLPGMQPDIILLDIEMPVMGGMETLEIMCERFPEIKVVMLSMYGGAGFISEFMTKGARAYLLKNCDPEDLFKAIHVVKTEGYYFDKVVSEAMLKGLQNQKPVYAPPEDTTLTDKEISVLKEVCEGKTNKEIALELNISVSTVDFHRSNLYKKTRSKNLLGILRYALKNGIVAIDEPL